MVEPTFITFIPMLANADAPGHPHDASAYVGTLRTKPGRGQEQRIS